MPLREALIEAGRDPPAADPDDDARADRRHDAGGARPGEGADFRAPLGRAVIGGVITSTLLTLLVIPTVYEIMVETREKIRGKFRQEEQGARSSTEQSQPEPKRRGGARPRPRPAEAVTSAVLCSA